MRRLKLQKMEARSQEICITKMAKAYSCAEHLNQKY